MRTLTALSSFCKRKVSALAIAVLLGATHAATGATFTNNNGVGSSLWNLPANWNTGTLPIATTIAYIPTGVSGASGSLFITTGSSGSLGTTASVGTLVINAPYTQYDRLRATNGYDVGGSIRDVVLTFGTAGALVYQPDTTQIPSHTFDISTAADNDGTITFDVTGSLGIQVAAGQVLHLNPRIVGTGATVTFSRIANTGSEDAEIKINSVGQEGLPSDYSTWSGGATLSSGVTLSVGTSSHVGTAGFDRGPLGIGTFNFDGGTLALGGGPQTMTLHNALAVRSLSVLESSTQTVPSLLGRFDANGNQLDLQIKNRLKFVDATFSVSDSGTLAFRSGYNNMLDFAVTAGTSAFGGAVGVAASGTLLGEVSKLGDGQFSAKHFRVSTLTIDQGTLKVNSSGTDAGGDAVGTSRVHTLNIAVGTTGLPASKFDLTNNDLIIDYTGTSPLGTLTNNGTQVTATGHLLNLRTGFAGGSWNGNGIITSTGAGVGSYAIAWSEASDLNGGTTSFSGQTVDNSSVLMKFTYHGDYNFDGQTNINDFSILGPNFNSAQPWTGGDGNYDGLANLGDFSLLAANFNAGSGGSAGVPLRQSPLAELYVAMLDYPAVYWESRSWPEFWNRYFAQFEGMNLGPIPPVPEYLVARGIPEPAIGAGLAWMAGALVWKRRRITPPGSTHPATAATAP